MLHNKYFHVKYYCKESEIDYLILRPFNTFGPRQSLRAIIPTIINQSLKKKKIKLGNLNARRDFTSVSETVEAFEKAIKNRKVIGKTINLGTKKDYSVLEIIRIISFILNKKISIQIDQKRLRPKKSEVDRLLSDNTTAKKILKWFPKSNNKKFFIKYLKETIDWFKKNKYSKNYQSNDYII